MLATTSSETDRSDSDRKFVAFGRKNTGISQINGLDDYAKVGLLRSRPGTLPQGQGQSQELTLLHVQEGGWAGRICCGRWSFRSRRLMSVDHVHNVFSVGCKFIRSEDRVLQNNIIIIIIIRSCQRRSRFHECLPSCSVLRTPLSCRQTQIEWP